MQAPAEASFLEPAPRLRSVLNLGVIGDAVVVVLAAFNIFRTLHHSMWRDELQIFQIAKNSGTLWDLFMALKYEAHPGLWHTLVWLLTRFTSDPTSMQLLHIVLALATWFVVYRWAPFNSVEKILLLSSYFLFWEYFVISRSYVLVALLAFGFVVLRQHRPEWRIIPWLMLGLLANTQLHGTILSMALGASLAFHQARATPAFLVGGTVYLALLGVAVATMMPAADYGPWGSDFRFDLFRLNGALAMPLGAFLPLEFGWFKDWFAFMSNPSTGHPPQFSNPSPVADVVAFVHADTSHPLRLGAVLIAPVALCWLIVRDRRPFLEFSIAYVGMLLFALLWNFPGNARHHGVLFVAFVAAAWTARQRYAPEAIAAWAFRALLVISAVGGVLTLASELRPFSQSRNAAAWITSNNLADALLIGSRDAQASSIAGYLGKPLYYLECECRGTFIVWNSKRQSQLSATEFGRRLLRAVDSGDQRDAILILNSPMTEEARASAVGLSIIPAASFGGAATDENYWIYRVAKRS